MPILNLFDVRPKPLVFVRNLAQLDKMLWSECQHIDGVYALSALSALGT